jgi:hypothetical protein
MEKDNIPEMELNKNHKESKIEEPKDPEKMQKEMEKTKKELEKLKNFIVKKYSYTKSISILPPQSIPLFIEEEEVPKESDKHIHLYMIIPEEKIKEIPKIKTEIIKEIESSKQKVWIQIKTPVDVWEACLDSKFEITA